jgi:hypothetical protein
LSNDETPVHRDSVKAVYIEDLEVKVMMYKNSKKVP